MIRLCRVDDLHDPGSRGFEVEGQSVFAVQLNGLVRVYRNRCPHLGIALEWLEDHFLDITKEYVQCATHGALFRIEDGHCIYGPCQGQRLESVDMEIVDGAVMIRL